MKMHVQQGGPRATHAIFLRQRDPDEHARLTAALRDLGLGGVCWWASRHLSRERGWKLMVAGEEALATVRDVLEFLDIPADEKLLRADS